ncbi:MAG: YceI family protein [Planctomycetota bacterium]
MTRFAPTLALALASMTFLAVPHSAAEEVAFDFADPKGVNGVVFVLDSELEPIVGMIGGVSGTVNFDPENPGAINGEVSVDLAQLSFVNSGMTDVLAGWLKISDGFVATFEFKGVEAVGESDGPGVAVETRGTMKFGGLDLPKSILIEATHLPDGAKARGGAEEGDLLVLRAAFEVSRKDLGIQKDMPTDKVGETISVIVPIVGYSK